MEIELKYKIKDKDLFNEILEDEYLIGLEEKGSREEALFKAAYFDTDDGVLAKNDIAFRVRTEGARVVATLKWNDTTSGALYVREEINVPVSDMSCFLNPSPELFKESDMGKDLLELLNGKTLRNVLEMRFVRKKMKIDTGGAICEVALDDGEIVTDMGNLHISELEIELFSGDRSQMIEVGEKLAEKYGLEAESESKYARGLRFLAQGGPAA
ncbi:MAG: CYTH domain-containing protein [Clostridiales Family XIII bacterium]|nr:CYTH domain-containing protein [Clostridiales Family XIII bacterium]